nr:IS110 family transposase [Paraburkholderia panacisoli]
MGAGSAWTLVRERFGWRQFRNRRELAGCLGLTPTPYASGTSEVELGISKAGNRRCRWLMAELAWSWLSSNTARFLLVRYPNHERSTWRAADYNWSTTACKGQRARKKPGLPMQVAVSRRWGASVTGWSQRFAHAA